MNCCARWRRACPWWNVADLTARRKAKGLIGRTADALAYYPRERIAAALRSRFALRLHTSVLLLWTFSAGLLTTKGVYALGLHSMFWRYTLAILVGYAAFLLGVRIWLAYVGVKTDAVGGDSNGRRQAQVDRSSSLDITDLLPSGRGGGSSPVFQGGGGGSGGGGASASFDAGAGAMPSNRYAPDISSASTAANVGGGGGGSSSSVGEALSGIGDLGGDDGCLLGGRCARAGPLRHRPGRQGQSGAVLRGGAGNAVAAGRPGERAVRGEGEGGHVDGGVGRYGRAVRADVGLQHPRRSAEVGAGRG